MNWASLLQQALESAVGVANPEMYSDPNKCDWKPEKEGWLRAFMQFVNTTWPHPDHLLVNAGAAGLVLENYANARCIEQV